jgi:hypothetical protein
MGGNRIIFKNRVKVLWFKFPSGEVKSFLFKEDEYKSKLNKVLSSGGREIPDPFRKGAPLGGYTHEG